MAVKLAALSAADGTGIFRSGQVVRLVRPPYTLVNAPVLPEESIRDAVLRHGFVASQQEFETWESAIDFLNDKAAEARHSMGMQVPETISGVEVIEVAPEGVIRAFLQRVETELIPRGLFEHAENLLLAFLKSKATTQYPGLTNTAAELIERCKDAQRSAEIGASGLSGSDLRFQSLRSHGETERSSKLADEIRRRHCVLDPCS
ncbi:MAG: hypothetical protein ACLQVL_22075 [Terriglobia bacterium]